jgi:hypothetical protein
MKQLYASVLLAILALAAFPLVAMAQADDAAVDASATIDAETETEVLDMNSGVGAQMRLYQLERALQHAVIAGNLFIERADARGANTTALVDIVAELEVMIKQVQDAEASAAENPEGAVEVFVTIKHDAKELIKEFREIAKDIVQPGDREALRDARDDADDSSLEDLRERIENARKEHRADQTERALRNAGIIDEELIAKIRAGEITALEIRERMKVRIADLDIDERRAAAASLREDASRVRVQALARLDKVETRLGEVEVRTKMRIEKLSEDHPVIAERIRTRLDLRMSQMNDRMEETRTRLEVRENEIRTREETRENGVRVRAETRISLGDDSSDDNSGSSSDDSSDDNSPDETDDSGMDSESDMNEDQ